MDFVKELQRRIKRIDAGEIKLPPKPPAVTQFKQRFYSLIKIEGGARTRVAFRLHSVEEGQVLAALLVKKMRRLPDHDDSGGPLFEITLSEIRKED